MGPMTVDRATGLIFGTFADRTVYALDSDRAETRLLTNLRLLPIDTLAIYDPVTGGFDALAGLIQTRQATYGDIAIRNRTDGFDLFVTGNYLGFAFVVRLRFGATLQSAKVVLSSRLVFGDGLRLPRGIAVNPQGKVLTTLPIFLPAQTQFFERLVSFSPDFPETRQGLPTPVFSEGIASLGMNTDSRGNFYIATGAAGTLACGAASSGVIVFVSADLREARCALRFNSAITRSQDISIGPQGEAYVAFSDSGRVVRFLGLAPAGSNSTPSAAGPAPSSGTGTGGSFSSPSPTPTAPPTSPC